MTPDEMIKKYILLRRKIEKIEADHKKVLEPYVNVRSMLETALLAHLNETNLQSVNSEAGTAYKSVATSVTVRDWPKTLEYIRANELWDLLEARVAKTAAVEVVEETKKPIPGVTFAQAVVLRVRAS